MSHRVEIGVVEAYHEETDQASVRVTVDLHEDHHVVVETSDGEMDLGDLHIEGTDEIEEGEEIALDVPRPVREGDHVYRIVEE